MLIPRDLAEADNGNTDGHGLTSVSWADNMPQAIQRS
jgi:hypothetical protein